VPPTDLEKKRADDAASRKFIDEHKAALAQFKKLLDEKAYIPAIKIHTDLVKRFVAFNSGRLATPDILLEASNAQRSLAYEIFKVFIKAPDSPERSKAIGIARDGFVQSKVFAKAAVDLAYAADKDPKLKNKATTAEYYSALVNHVDAVSMVARYVEYKVSENTHQTFLQLLSVEKDASRRQALWLRLADLHLNSMDDFVKANDIYVMVLKDSPNNADALHGLGYNHCVNLSAGLTDKPAIITCAGYFKRFLAVAPANDPRRKDTQETLDYLKANHGVIP